MSKISFESQVINLPNKRKLEPTSFTFKGKNDSDKDITLTIKPACGCTEMVSEQLVKAKTNFEIKGELKTPPSKGAKTKTIKVTTNEPFEFNLIFNVNYL